jgi:uncharacterized membrane protein
MRTRIVQFWIYLKSSYWFVPAVMASAAAVLALLLIRIDQDTTATVLADFDWIYANTPDAARSLLSTIAGSMITVAGVTFAITIAAVAHASSLYGPRLLTNFMRDRGNQISLGAFIATFVYCLLVLRSVQSPSETLDREGSG